MTKDKADKSKQPQKRASKYNKKLKLKGDFETAVWELVKEPKEKYKKKG